MGSGVNLDTNPGSTAGQLGDLQLPVSSSLEWGMGIKEIWHGKPSTQCLPQNQGSKLVAVNVIMHLKTVRFSSK